MRVLVWAVHHRTAELALREKLALNEQQTSQLLRRLVETWPHGQFLVLSTCNRTEIYLARPIHQPPNAEQLAELVAEYCGVEKEVLCRSAVMLDNQQAVAHLFCVAGGLESMVLGEEQILGQVRRAWELAREHGTLGAMLDRLFQQAVAAARQVRRQTGLDRLRLSVGWAAAQWLQEVYNDLCSRTVLMLGAGTVAKLTLKQLKNLKPGRLILANRTLAHIVKLNQRLRSEGLHCEARALSELEPLLLEADVVLSAVAGEEPILRREQLESVMSQRADRPLVILDLAVPRSIEPAAGQIPGVQVRCLDDLQEIVNRRFSELGQPLQRARQLLEQAAHAAWTWAQHRELGELICALRRRLEELGQRETARTLRKLMPWIAAPQQEAIQNLIHEHTRRLINKFLHLPLSQINPRRASASPAFLAAAMRALFALDPVQEADKKAETTGTIREAESLFPQAESGPDRSLESCEPRSSIQRVMLPEG